MRDVISSIEGEYRRYQRLAEEAIEQLSDEQLADSQREGDNSAATVVRHIGGNLRSRFTDFLTSDGEKPWRDRESEFAWARPSREDVLAVWNSGWDALTGALSSLTDDDLGRQVAIRGQALSVIEALHRSLSHTAYHVGQIVYIAKALRGPDWKYLSIPPGGSAAYLANPTLERP